MKYHEYSPHAILQDTVRCFWILETTYPVGGIQDVTPDGCVELIFNFGSPYVPMAAAQASALPVAFVVGFQDKTVRFRVEGTVKIVAARLFAWGALPILQEHAASLSNTVTVLGPGWDDLVGSLERHVAQGNYEQAATNLHEYLIQQALIRTFDPGLIQAAAKLLHHRRGQYRVDELADYCRMSVRQLERGFQREVGTSPKTFARTMRFERAERRLMFDPQTDLGSLAYDCGYFDQAHFIKEFKKVTGKTPSEYAREMQKLQSHLKSQDVVFLQASKRPGT